MRFSSEPLTFSEASTVDFVEMSMLISDIAVGSESCKERKSNSPPAVPPIGYNKIGN